MHKMERKVRPLLHVTTGGDVFWSWEKQMLQWGVGAYDFSTSHSTFLRTSHKCVAGSIGCFPYFNGGSEESEENGVSLNKLCCFKVAGARCDRPGGPHEQFKALLSAINAYTNKYSLRMANRLYGSNRYSFRQVRKSDSHTFPHNPIPPSSVDCWITWMAWFVYKYYLYPLPVFWPSSLDWKAKSSCMITWKSLTDSWLGWFATWMGGVCPMPHGPPPWPQQTRH